MVETEQMHANTGTRSLCIEWEFLNHAFLSQKKTSYAALYETKHFTVLFERRSHDDV